MNQMSLWYTHAEIIKQEKGNMYWCNIPSECGGFNKITKIDNTTTDYRGIISFVFMVFIVIVIFIIIDYARLPPGTIKLPSLFSTQEKNKPNKVYL